MKPIPPLAEEAQPDIIPTVSRSKIPRNLSYPVGAEVISKALRTVPQFSELKLIFFSWKFDVDVRSGRGRYEQPRYEFIRVEYLNGARPKEEWPISSLWGRPPRNQWEIVVQPVSRALRHRIAEYIIESALPRMKDWLALRSELSRRGSDLLAFLYDEGLEEFIPRTLSGLEPIRTKNRSVKKSSQLM